MFPCKTRSQVEDESHSSSPGETDITGYICEALDDWFRNHPQESFCFFLRDDPPLAGGGRPGKHRVRTDIIISYAAGNRPEFFFEAKRLHRTTARAARYTGDGGMGCFISARYASKYCEAAMIGYVQTDTLEHWNQTLRKKVETDRRDLNLDAVEADVVFADSFPLEWSSTHHRDGLQPIKVLHILLDCRQKAAAKH